MTNGTPGILDNQDAFTVTVALTGYEFDKTVADLTSGANPATTAAPGDKLRYTLRFRTTNQALSNFSIVDDMDALNAQADFAPGTLTLVTFPAGADISATSSTGGSKAYRCHRHSQSEPAGQRRSADPVRYHTQAVHRQRNGRHQPGDAPPRQWHDLRLER